MKKMVVVFENLEQVHLGKDVGALPLALQQNEGWDVSLYSTLKHFADDEYEKNVKLKFFTKFKNQKLNKLLLFIDVLKNAKKIDYLMVFHGGKDKSILFWLCKKRNKNLTSYVKLDMGELNANSIIHKSSDESFFKKTARFFLSKPVDTFTVETKQVFEVIKDLPQYRNKIHYLPNGFYADRPYDWTQHKEKIIISVGRIGTPPKNNELLLSAIEQLESIGEYVFYFIGPVEQSFRKSVDSLLARRGDLTDKIVLTGNISNKQELYGYYKRAEILCFTSIYEGFSLVMAEALYFGCYLVSTDLAAAYDLSDNGNYGQIVNVNQALINDCKEQGITDIVQYCDNNFEAILLTEWFSQSSKKLCFTLQNIIDGKVDTNTAAHYLACNTYENFNWISIAKNLLNIFEECKREK
jgi:glycosyltransferase involved in cell wall biosynthesis